LSYWPIQLIVDYFFLIIVTWAHRQETS